MGNKQTEPAFVFVDTNIIFDVSQESFFSPAFRQKWSECCSSISLRLLIPEVVKHERHSQQARALATAVDRGVENFRTIASRTGVLPPKWPALAEQVSCIDDRIEVEMKALEAELVPTPYDKIDWKEIVKDAVWRNPPFESGDTEKGFKDRIILETIREHRSRHPDKRYVFISGDKVIKHTPEQIWGTRSGECFAGLNAFASDAKLIQANIEERVRLELTARAPSVFHSPTDSNSVWVACGVPEKIEQSIEKIGGGVFMQGTDWKTALELLNYEAKTAFKIDIEATSFTGLTRPHSFHWKTAVRYSRLMGKRDFGGHRDKDPFSYRTQVINFAVSWSADVDVNDSFSNLKTTDVELIQCHTEMAFFTNWQYGLQS